MGREEHAVEDGRGREVVSVLPEVQGQEHGQVEGPVQGSAGERVSTRIIPSSLGEREGPLAYTVEQASDGSYTVHAALLEGFRGIGIESDAEMAAFARRRIAGPLFAQDATEEADE